MASLQFNRSLFLDSFMQSSLMHNYIPSSISLFTLRNNDMINCDTNLVTYNNAFLTKPIRIVANSGTTCVDLDSFYSTSVIYTTDTASTNSYYWYDKPLTSKEKFKQQLKLKMAPAILSHRGQVARSAVINNPFNQVTPQEIVALQLLRGMVSHEVFKKYLKYGFVIVQGQSGLIYQICRNQNHIVVWYMGKRLCELCVRLSDHGIPPTDAVISKLLICECDEIDIWRRANIYWKDVLAIFKSITSNTIEPKHLLQLVA